MVPSRAWLFPIGRYIVMLDVGNLTWEFAQMPLYSPWSTGSWRKIVVAAGHCAASDVLIGGAALFGVLLLFGTTAWPNFGCQIACNCDPLFASKCDPLTK